MGWVDRINDALLRRLRPDDMPGGAAAMMAELEASVRLVAFTQPGYIGGTTTLVGEFADGRVLQADEHDPAWGALLEALDRSGRTAMSATQWTLSLAAADAVPLTLIGGSPQDAA